MPTTLAVDSLAGSMSLLPVEQRRQLLSELSEEDCQSLLYDWHFYARHDQIAPPGEWRTWLVLAGRGWGKTRVGAEWVRESVKHFGLVNVIAPTSDDARDVMIEGESGILAICPDDERPEYLPSKRRLEWPNGARTLIFTADEPDRLRGKQHERIWADELAAWRHPEAWDQAMMGLRLGSDPRAVATTTPRPVKSILDLMAEGSTITTRGNTYDNAENLAPAFLDKIIKKYEGTRMGRQELLAEILTDVPGALWTRTLLDKTRVKTHPDLARVVVAIDPSGGDEDGNDAQGIVVAGRGVDGQAYVLDDVSCKLSPDGWGKRAVNAYRARMADRIVAEGNFGGAMVEHVVRTVDPTVSYKQIHASRGKKTRAEPVAALYEQGRVHHVGAFSELEDELCQWTPDTYDGSPDRLDALVWAITDLMLAGAQVMVY
jgi:predicted phage terminase large subunit-like protein